MECIYSNNDNNTISLELKKIIIKQIENFLYIYAYILGKYYGFGFICFP